ncbi:hypothetical protein NDU88_003729 [Pleurodeles waltl]|uniref:Uncharacterized protein n=1 Tax=Pleurodeles waltl TaxID=8319 RepID=A0AAV7WPX3_PLEWA|nr:hypothetical protein NDU88_003729 [Pleurodeles waltl]
MALESSETGHAKDGECPVPVGTAHKGCKSTEIDPVDLVDGSKEEELGAADYLENVFSFTNNLGTFCMGIDTDSEFWGEEESPSEVLQKTEKKRIQKNQREKSYIAGGHRKLLNEYML